MTRCLKVPRQDAEEARNAAIEAGVLDRGHRISRDGEHVYIPVTADLEGRWEMVDWDAPVREETEGDYRRIAQVPEELRDLLPSSFDIIGDVAIVRLPPELEEHSKAIGEAMLTAGSNLRLVLRDGGVKGETRVRELESIAGEGESETLHTEFGVRMLVDPRRVYFNPRLANERHRIAQLVREGETIIDMFAGAGPFPLVIWKNSPPARIYAVDLNPAAVEYMEKNIRLNRTDGITPLQGDVNEVMEGLPLADRIIMNLPQSAADFLPLAISRCRPGATLHLYLISEREDWPDMLDRVLASGEGRELQADMEKELKTYSPTMSVYALDLRIP